MPNLIEIRIIGVFIAALSFIYVGWHLKTVSIESAQIKAITKQVKVDYNVSGNFERTQADIDKLYSNLNTKLTYENNYSCLIPIDGLQLLSTATAQTR